MASGTFQDSFAFIDADGRLSYWDEGFEQEFHSVAHLLRPGVAYAEILHAKAASPDFATLRLEFSDTAAMTQAWLAGLGNNRTGEYQTPDGRMIRVMQYRTSSGGVRRFARDLTEERNPGEDTNGGNGRAAIDPASLGAVLTQTRRNPDGTYVFEPISEGLARLLDLPHQFVGQDAIIFYSRMMASAEDNALHASQMERSARTLESFSQEYHVRDGHNRMRWLRNSMMPQRLPDGAVIFSGVIRDVTREKDAEDQVELLRSVVVRSSDSIIIFETAVAPERRTTILYANPMFTELFGGSGESLVGQPMEVLVGNDLNGVGSRSFSAALSRDDGLPFEYETLGKGGRIFWIEVRIKIVQTFDDGGFRWVVMSRDVSERRHAQDELLRAKDAAEESNRAKSHFLANMSHELRTPLNAIIGFTEVIEHGIARTGWMPAYAEYLADVSTSGRHLLDLINTILDLSKIEAGQLALALEPVDVCELIRSSLALLSGMARDGGIVLSADIPADWPEIQGDYLKLKQVLLNVLSNAIKFTPSGGKVDVELRYTEAEAMITVTDTGCGIPEADLERVMLPFVQVANTLSRKFGGSGLGLAIARELCDLHGGRLEIMSVERAGTTARISLPRRQSD